jgi:hypothetical protein
MKLSIAMWGKALRVIPRVSKEEWKELDPIAKWLIATRSAIFVLTFFSATVGALLAAADDAFSWPKYLLCVFGLVFAHGANNLANDYTDSARGVDKDNYFRTMYGPQTVENGLWSRQKMRMVIGLSALLAATCGFILFLLSGPAVLWLMIEGYGGDVVGQQAQTQSLQGYTGYYGRIAAVDVADVRYPSGFRVRGVGVNSSYVHDHWVPPTGKVLVDVRACESISLSWAFTNNGLSDMVAFCGNADTVTVRQSIDGITRLYQNLGGVNGVRKRTLANALDGQEWFWSPT